MANQENIFFLQLIKCKRTFCLFIGCVLPPVPYHASMNVSSDGLEISYTCNVGYTLNGNRTLTCLSDGSGWHADAPLCCMF